MPNVATHPVRAPREPCKGYKGEIPYTTLEIPTVYNPDLNRSTFYQDGYQKFSNIPVDRSREICDCVRQELNGPGDLDNLRELYSKIIDKRGKVIIETRLLRLLQRKIDAVFSRIVKEAIANSDSESLEILIEEVENDPLLAASTKSIDIDAVKDTLPEIREAEVAKQRDRADRGAGGHRKSSAPVKRRSTVTSCLNRSLQSAQIKGWDYVSFNAQSGRLNVLKEILYEKRKTLYQNETPVAVFADPEQVNEVLKEAVQIWNIFKVRVDVVQAHKSPYNSKQVDGGQHEEWLQQLALARAKKMTETLAELGIPSEMMTAQVHVVESSPCMQYLNFSMDLRHTRFQHVQGRIDLTTELSWQKRRFGRGGFDQPEAVFENKALAAEVLAEVEKVWRVHKCDIDIVIHRQTLQGAHDDEHEMWYDQLLSNRGKCIRDELLRMGIPEERLMSKVQDAEGIDLGSSLHFEIIRTMRGDDFAEYEGPSEVSAAVIVDGCAPYEFNGRYKPAGEMNGETKYRHESGGKATICFGADGFWYLCYNHNPKNAYFKSKGLGGHEMWKAARTESTGGLIPVVHLIDNKNDDARSTSTKSGGSIEKQSPPPRGRSGTTTSLTSKGFLDDSDSEDMQEEAEEEEDDAF